MFSARPICRMFPRLASSDIGDLHLLARQERERGKRVKKPRGGVCRTGREAARGISVLPLTRTSDMSARTRRQNGAACSLRGVFRIASAGRVLVTRFTLAFPDRLRPKNRQKKNRISMKLRGEVVVRGRPRKSFFFAAGCRPAVVRADRFRSWLHSRLHT